MKILGIDEYPLKIMREVDEAIEQVEIEGYEVDYIIMGEMDYEDFVTVADEMIPDMEVSSIEAYKGIPIVVVPSMLSVEVISIDRFNHFGVR